MPASRRPSKPQSASFASPGARASRQHPYYWLVIFFALFAIPLFAIHLPLLTLPFFWDELGQFVPTALDLLRKGAWIAQSTTPNVHPPGVELYLAIWYKLFGFSIAITRTAMPPGSPGGEPVAGG